MHSQCVRACANVCVNSDALQVGKVMGVEGLGGRGRAGGDLATQTSEQNKLTTNCAKRQRRKCLGFDVGSPSEAF